jgi:hypothetical protein
MVNQTDIDKGIAYHTYTIAILLEHIEFVFIPSMGPVTEYLAD